MRGGSNMPEDKDDTEQFRKLFVGGLHFETTEKSLKEYFEQFGEVVDTVVMKDSNTQRSRGFGFVTFKSGEMLDEAQKARPHRIDDKDVETKRAMPREEAGRPDIHVMSKKLYVSGVKEGLEESDLRDYFGRYGNVDSVEIIVDKATGQRRGFAFVSFEDYDTVDKIVLIKSHNIKDRRCDVKKAMSKEEMQQLKSSDMRSGMRGGRGMGRGFDRRVDMGYGGGRNDYDGYRRGGGDYMGGYDGYRSNRGTGYGSRDAGYGYNSGPRSDEYGAGRYQTRDSGYGGGYERNGGYGMRGGYGGSAGYGREGYEERRGGGGGNRGGYEERGYSNSRGGDGYGYAGNSYNAGGYGSGVYSSGNSAGYGSYRR